MLKIDINKIISDYEKGEIELHHDYDFHEVDYIDGISDRYIVHNLKGYDDVQLLFSEYPEAINFRKKYDEAGEEEKQSLLIDYGYLHNDLENEFNYDNVVGYITFEGGVQFI